MTLYLALFGAGRIGKLHAASIKSDPHAKLLTVTVLMEGTAKTLA